MGWIEIPSDMSQEDAKNFQAWMDEYYPTDADSPEAQAAPATHSYSKWQGMLPENLARYSMFREGDNLYVGDYPLEVFGLHADTCALCEAYECGECPFANEDAVCCDDGSPYRRAIFANDLVPLLRVLKKCADAEDGVTAAREARPLVRVCLSTSYVAYADEPEMITRARAALWEDVCTAIKYNELNLWLDEVPAPEAVYTDIPDFLLPAEDEE